MILSSLIELLKKKKNLFCFPWLVIYYGPVMIMWVHFTHLQMWPWWTIFGQSTMGLQTQLISLNLSLLVVVAALFGLQGCDGRDKAIRHKTDVWQAHKAESNPRSQKAFFIRQFVIKTNEIVKKAQFNKRNIAQTNGPSP